MRIPDQVSVPLGTLITTMYRTCRRIAAIIAGAALALSASGLRADTDSDPLRVLMLGDSLTSGYGLPSRASLPARLDASLEALGLDVTVINAGVSGDTSAGGLARLEWALADDPHAVVVALGANDALRALDPEITRNNLDRLVRALAERGLPVLIAGMLAPRNLGVDYARALRRDLPRARRSARRAPVPLSARRGRERGGPQPERRAPSERGGSGGDRVAHPAERSLPPGSNLPSGGRRGDPGLRRVPGRGRGAAGMRRRDPEPARAGARRSPPAPRGEGPASGTPVEDTGTRRGSAGRNSSPIFVVRASRCRGSGSHGPRDAEGRAGKSVSCCG